MLNGAVAVIVVAGFDGFVYDAIFSAVALHLRRVHEKERDHKRSSSDKHFFEEPELEKHIHQVHEKQESHKCHICDISFDLLANLKRHNVMLHAKAKTIDYSCDICKQPFEDEENLLKHVKCEHLGNDAHKNQLNDTLTKEEEKESKLLADDESAENKRFFCHICDLSFYERIDLAVHVEKEH